MADYIDRDAVYHAISVDCALNIYEKAYCLDIVRKITSADVAPVRHGRWIKRGYACGENEYECSVCHETEWRTSASRMKYCMFCGAKMVLKGESEDG